MEKYADMLADGKKQLGEIVKMWDFRHKYVLMVEGYLRMSGYKDTVAVLGLKQSFNFKASKHSFCVFEIGVAPMKFHLILYELAYINVPSMSLIAEAEFSK